MPYYRKRRTFKRRTFKRRRSTPWYNRKYSVAQMASKAIKGVNYIRGLVNSEMLKQDFSTSSALDIATGVVTHLTAFAIGDDDFNRTGNSIYVRHIYSRGEIVMDSAATSTTVRLMLVQDTQQVGDTSPVVNDIIGGTDNSFKVYRPLNADTVGRFSILYSRNFILNSQRPSVLFNIRKTMRLHVRYNGTATTDIQRNGLYLVAFSNEATNTPDISSITRVSYHDN